MMIIIMMFTLAIIISIILSIMMFLSGRNYITDREKMSPFECGFDPHKKSRSPFSLNFFLVTMMFLIFDVEIVILIPLSIISKSNDPFIVMITALIMTIILIIGLVHEWNQGALNWLN